MSENFIKGETKKPFKDNPLRFMLSTGYTREYNPLAKDVVMNSIMYCPFCGKDLYKYYKDFRYANEVEGETFTL